MWQPRVAEATREKIFAAINRFMFVVASLAVASLVVEHGGYLPAYTLMLQILDVAIISIFVVEHFVKLLVARDRKAFLRANIPDFIFIALFPLYFTLVRVLVFLEYLNIRSATKLYIVVVQVWIVLSLLLKGVRAHTRLAHTRFRPAQMLVVTFLVIIAFGVICLYSPNAVSSRFASRAGKAHLALEDAVFTATSAVCVTGLIVKDTGSDFSLGGQIVILTLLQVGGLGLMTITSFFALVLGRGLGLRERAVMQDVLSYDVLGQVARMIVYILVGTLAFELLGAALLYGCWREADLERGHRAYLSIFHAISAFCNAGFSLLTESLRNYRSAMRVNLLMSVLIIVGGLGFVVHRNLGEWVWVRLKVLFRRAQLSEPPHLSLQTKIVLVTTACFLVVGALAVLAFDGHNPALGSGFKEKLLAASFQSTTARTAGFSTVDTDGLSVTSKFLTIILMFIGASPGSTGGGIKTATFVIVLFTVISLIRNREQVEVFKRSIPRFIASRALAVLFLGLFVVSFVTICLSLTERGQGHSFLDLLFETVSAFGTVGLSTGVTPTLSAAGKLLLSVTMLTGRIGPLTLVVALGQRTAREAYEYPEEGVMIG